MISMTISTQNKAFTLNSLRIMVSILTIIALAVAAKPSQAQGSWPPTAPQAGDKPFTTGVFTSNGRTYTITFVDVSNVAADPFQVPPGTPLASVTNNGVTTTHQWLHERH